MLKDLLPVLLALVGLIMWLAKLDSTVDQLQETQDLIKSELINIRQDIDLDGQDLSDDLADLDQRLYGISTDIAVIKERLKIAETTTTSPVTSAVPSSFTARQTQ